LQRYRLYHTYSLKTTSHGQNRPCSKCKQCSTEAKPKVAGKSGGRWLLGMQLLLATTYCVMASDETRRRPLKTPQQSCQQSSTQASKLLSCFIADSVGRCYLPVRRTTKPTWLQHKQLPEQSRKGCMKYSSLSCFIDIILHRETCVKRFLCAGRHFVSGSLSGNL
jgi:hypothetical protein